MIPLFKPCSAYIDHTEMFFGVATANVKNLQRHSLVNEAGSRGEDGSYSGQLGRSLRLSKAYNPSRRRRTSTVSFVSRAPR